MRFFTSHIKRYLEYYYTYNNSMRSLAAINQAWGLSIAIKSVFFNRKIDHQEIINVNREFSHLLQNKDKKRLNFALIRAEKKIPDIQETLSLINTLADEEGINLSNTTTNWFLGCIGMEVR